MKQFKSVATMLAGLVVLAGSAMAQQEVSPDHFDGSPTVVRAQKAVRPVKKASVKKQAVRQSNLPKASMTARLQVPVR